MAPIAAFMYASAGAVVGISLLLPHSPEMNRGALLGAALVGPLTAIGIWLLRRRLRRWFFHLTTAAGTVLAGLCVYWSGEAAVAVLVSCCCGLPCSAPTSSRPPALAAHLAFAAAVYAVVARHRIRSPTPTWQRTGSSPASASRSRARSSRALVHSRRQLEDERERLLAHDGRARPDRPAHRSAQPPRLARPARRRARPFGRRGTPVCVAMLDLDHFKRFNDDHGHVAGDAFLQQLAAEWRAAVRPSDTLARYGGEEFALLLPNCDVTRSGRGDRAPARLRAARRVLLGRRRVLGRRQRRRSP